MSRKGNSPRTWQRMLAPVFWGALVLGISAFGIALAATADRPGPQGGSEAAAVTAAPPTGRAIALEDRRPQGRAGKVDASKRQAKDAAGTVASPLAGKIRLLSASNVADPRVLQVRGHSFVAGTAEKSLPSELLGKAAKWSGAHIVQFAGPVTPGHRKALKDLGATIHEYYPNNAFLVTIPAKNAAALKAIDGLAWTGLYHPAYKIYPTLLGDKIDFRMEKNLPVLLVRTFSTDAVDALRLRLMELGGAILATSARPAAAGVAVAIDLARIADIARMDEVWTIDAVEKAFEMNVELVPTTTVGAFTWDRKLWDRGVDGTGQAVGILDAGLDMDNFLFRETATGSAPAGPDARKVKENGGWGAGYVHECEFAHGTHVAGTVAGNASGIGYFPTWDGVARGADIIFQDHDVSCETTSVAPPAFYALPFEAAYALGARVHTNSWGGGNGSYGAAQSDVDQFLWDNKDFLVFYAMGNAGPGITTVSNQATAKNIVAVGAHEQDPMQDEVASFSSRGPVATASGRMAPTITTPGNDFVGSSPEGNAANNTGITSAYADGVEGVINNFVTGGWGGTSMATPAAAGAALLVRQYFEDGYYPEGVASTTGRAAMNPSGALVKAVLVNATRNMDGDSAKQNLTGTEAGGRPNNDQGWGRLALDDALYFCGDDHHLFIDDNAEGVATAGTVSYTVQVNDPGKPLKVTLVWTDRPGDLLVNNLDLTMAAPGSVGYTGNFFRSATVPTSTGWSLPDEGTPVTDTKHNIENIFIEAPAAGTYTVTVTGQNVPQGEDDSDAQPFALVITGLLDSVGATTFGEVGPDAPELSAPFAGYSSDDTTPTLVFSTPSAPAGELLTYQVQVDSDYRFFSPVVFDAGLYAAGADKSFTIPAGTITGDGIQYWRVRAAAEGGCWGPWSDVWSFTVDSELSSVEFKQSLRPEWEQDERDAVILGFDGVVTWKAAQETNVSVESSAVTESSFRTSATYCGPSPSECRGALAADGSSDSPWISFGDPQSSPEWVEIDFAAARTIRQVIVDSAGWIAGNRPGSFELQSWDGDEWITGGTVTAGTGGVKTLVLGTAATSDKFRLYVTAREDTAGARPVVINEIELYENSEVPGAIDGPAIPISAYDPSSGLRASLLSLLRANDWDWLSWAGSGTVSVQVQYLTGTTWAPIPDADLPGNSTGLATSPVDLSDLDADTYSTIRVVGMFAATTGEPGALDWWTIGEAVFPPTVTSPSPEDGDTGVYRFASISFTVAPGSYDLDYTAGTLADLVATISEDEGTAVTMYDGANGGFQTGYTGSVTAYPGGTYAVFINPDADFGAGVDETVSITIGDTAPDRATGALTFTFTTSGDIAGPVISNVRVTDIVKNTAIVRWWTNEPASSVVTYGEATPPGETVGSATLVQDHAVTLSSLGQDTVHYFSVSSADIHGNATTDDNSSNYYWFQTGTTQWSGTTFNFDSGVPPEFSVDTAVSGGGVDWTLEDPASHYSSADGAYHSDDPNANKDDRLVAAIAVPDVSPVELRFSHAHEFEYFFNYYDGGVLEYSTNAGASWDDMGSMMTQNGYNGPIDDCCNNPLAGRDAWVGATAGFGGSSALPSDVVVDLSTFAGDTIQVRWRLGADDPYYYSYDGWYVDDVRVGRGGEVMPTSTAQLELGAAEYGCGDEVAIRLGDTDLNTSPDVAEQATVLVTSTSQSNPADAVVVTLTETATYTGRYAGTVPLSTEAGPGRVMVADGDTVYVTYTDEVTGGPAQDVDWTQTATVNCAAGAPVINAVKVEFTDDATALVSWNTDILASSIVWYGVENDELTQTVSSGFLVASHVVTISNLQDATRYYFSVGSRAANGTLTTYGTTDSARAQGRVSESSLSFTTKLEVASLFADNFDDGGIADWTPSTAPNTWGLDNGDSYSGTFSIGDSPGTGYDTDVVGSYLSSPVVAGPVTLGVDDEIVAKWWQSVDTETGWDFGILQASEDGGTTWNAGDYFATGHRAQWLPAAATVVTGAGTASNLAVRFNFYADSYYGYDGWNVDDVEIVHLRNDRVAPTVASTPADGSSQNGVSSIALDFTDEGHVDLGFIEETLAVSKNGAPMVPGTDFTVSAESEAQLEITFTAPGEGTYVVHSYPTDTAGNMAAANTTTVIDDRTPPEFDSSWPASGTLVVDVSVVRLYFSDNGDLDEVETAASLSVIRDGVALSLGTDYTVDTSVANTIQITFADTVDTGHGVYSISFVPSDEAGNVGSGETLVFAADAETFPVPMAGAGALALMGLGLGVGIWTLRRRSR
ncbi:MAG: S8 family serine peptidase [Candidatus Schekmanbacteria bacterium]|nr:S8 family serine peptidase [Candidatus Schekmanbacteria bacterium]